MKSERNAAYLNKRGRRRLKSAEKEPAGNQTGSNTVCEYCTADEYCSPLDWKYGLDHIFPDYKFCPMCGRKMR